MSRNRRRRQLRNRIICAAIGVGVCLMVLILLVKSPLFHKKQAESSGAASTPASAKTTEVQETINEDVKIQDLLKKDTYSQQLTELYAKHPEVSEIILNRERYPDFLIEYLVGHTEALDWVADYPKYSQKDPAEIDGEALKPVNIADYSVQGNAPMYFQWDKTWGYASYGTGLLAVDGCGPTALSMVVTGLTGDTSMTPKRIADFSTEKGYYTEEFGTDWMLMSDGAEQLGLRAKEVNSSASSITRELNAGKMIICSMGPGDFTEKGHFIVLCGVTEDGKIIVNDPNSQTNSLKRWDAAVLEQQIKGIWSYSLP